MDDSKNIEKLLKQMQEKELPKDYDQRFFAKIERLDDPVGSFLNKFSIPGLSMNVGWAASLGAAALVILSVLRNRHDSSQDMAINDEIDMLNDLDILENWNEEDNV